MTKQKQDTGLCNLQDIKILGVKGSMVVKPIQTNQTNQLLEEFLKIQLMMS